MKSNTSGFTLTEILLVIGIIGLLAAVTIPNLSGARKSGQQSAIRNYLGVCSNAAEQQRNFHSGSVTLPGTCQELVGTSAAPLKRDTIALSGDTYIITLTDSWNQDYTNRIRRYAPQ